jgi:tetratricopeptide (TPR) repeat protein
MSEHELWNELGNLYFMTGAYKQASYAYNRSIQQESRFGRPYTNLALAYVQQGKFAEAVDLYRSSIELLTDNREKAISWFRLGDVYRRLKDYRDAILAYQQADLLDPGLSQDEDAVGKVLYGASNLTASPEPAPIEAEKTGQVKPEAVISEPVKTEAVLSEPVKFKAVIPEPVEAEVLVSESPKPELRSDVLVDTAQPEQIELDSEESVSSPMLEVFKEEIEPGNTIISTDIEQTPPGFSENELPDFEEELPDDWMFSTDTDIPDETLSEWITNVRPEPESAVIYPAPVENYPASNYSAPASPLPAESGQIAYSDRKDLMVVEVKQPITAFVVAPDEQGLSTPVEMAGETIEETSQATPKNHAEDQNGIELEIEALRRNLQNDPINAPAWDDLGELYKSLRIYKEAIPAYQQAVANDPKNIQYLYHLGCAYAIEGYSDDAVKTFQHIVKLDSGHALAHASLGGYYRKMGLEELAQKHIGKAVKNFFDSENEYNQACLQALCGNIDDAIELLRSALQTEQTYVDWVLRDPDLDSIRMDPRFKQLISDFS